MCMSAISDARETQKQQSFLQSSKVDHNHSHFFFDKNWNSQLNQAFQADKPAQNSFGPIHRVNRQSLA